MAESVAQQRRRTERCKDCRGWGFVPGHDPMKICDCVVPTDHDKFRLGAPAGVTVDVSRGGAAVTKAAKGNRAKSYGFQG
jgi:hypothetical protein